MPAVDSWGHAVTYAVSYSPDAGNSWILLESGLTQLSYSWDTKTVANGDEYRLKVVASCTDELTTEFCYAYSFTILNEDLSTTTTSHTASELSPLSEGLNAGMLLSILFLLMLPYVRGNRKP